MHSTCPCSLIFLDLIILTECSRYSNYATGWTVWDSIFGGDRRFFSAGSGTHPASYSEGTGGVLARGLKQPGRDVYKQTPSSAVEKNEWSCTSIPLYTVMSWTWIHVCGLSACFDITVSCSGVGSRSRVLWKAAEVTQFTGRISFQMTMTETVLGNVFACRVTGHTC